MERRLVQLWWLAVAPTTAQVSAALCAPMTRNGGARPGMTENAGALRIVPRSIRVTFAPLQNSLINLVSPMQPQLRKLERGKSRLFDPMHKIVLVMDSVGIASMFALLNRVDPIEETPRNATRVECVQFPMLVVRVPILTLLRTTVQGAPVSDFIIGFVDKKPPPPLPLGRAQSTIERHGALALQLMTPIYVDFFEKHRSWIKNKFGGDAYAWPSIFNFARALRNFVSHHSGQVHFENPNAGPVSWHHLSYSPSDEGRSVLSADIEIGDLIVLLFELSDELDKAGCPTNP
jgi:hypothetical protein